MMINSGGAIISSGCCCNHGGVGMLGSWIVSFGSGHCGNCGLCTVSCVGWSGGLLCHSCCSVPGHCLSAGCVGDLNSNSGGGI
eukprot:3457768-Amphidinium_carterae.2